MHIVHATSPRVLPLLLRGCNRMTTLSRDGRARRHSTPRGLGARSRIHSAKRRTFQVSKSVRGTTLGTGCSQVCGKTWDLSEKTWEYARFLSGLFWPLECMAVCGKRYIRLAAPTSPVSSISTDCSLLLLQINPYILYMMCLHSERSPGRQEGQQANIARLLRRCNDHNVLVSLPTNQGRCFCHAPVVSAHFRSRRPPLEG